MMRAMRLLGAALLCLLPISGSPAASAGCLGGMPQCWFGVSDPFVNDPSCVSADRPPVMLIHGTFMDQTISWPALATALHDAGYCVWALDYGERASNDMEQSVEELLAFARDIVLPHSGTGTFSAIGHSQGGLQIRHMLLHDPSLPIEDAISLSGSHYGTDTPSAKYAADWASCPACAQQMQGSEWMTGHMNAGDPTPGAAAYTQLETTHDEIVTPNSNTFLPEEPGVVTNVMIQDRCPQDPFDHIAFTYDPFAIDWALNALATPGPADPAHVPIGCL